MNKISLLTFALFILFGCNKTQRSTGDEMKGGQEDSLTKIAELRIEPLDEWPQEIMGCSCYFSHTKSEFANKNYIYIDNYKDLAFLKINGQIEKFKLLASDTLTASVGSVKSWKNDNFEMTIEMFQIGQIEIVIFILSVIVDILKSKVYFKLASSILI